MATTHAFVEVEYREGREPEVVKCEDALRLKTTLNSRELNPSVTAIRVYRPHRTVSFTRSRTEEYHEPDQTPPTPEEPREQLQ